jgi:bifunctional enzyme CysN/CysC
MTSPAKAMNRQGLERLRFLTCGSVDDGKSTLIGRLLYDSGQIPDDQMAALERDSLRNSTLGGALDFSLLVDGLEAEREQNITIDVAYRYFATPARSFMVADTPGHEQYTRNMATGASTADLAVILIDARKGVLPQTCRHARICALMGIKHVVLAINKIDLVGFNSKIFNKIRMEFERFAAGLDFHSVQPIPVSALLGDNVLRRSVHAHWYVGPTLIEYLENVEVLSDRASKPLRMAVQLVRRPSSDMRVLSGSIASGTLAKGQQIAVAVSGATSRVKSLWGPDGELDQADAGLAVSLTLEDEIDAARGDLLVTPGARPQVADQFTAHLVWIAAEPMLAGRRHLMRIGARWVFASVSQLKYRLNINTGEHETADRLALNEIGVVDLATDLPVAFDAFRDDRSTGAFILVDRDTNAIVAAGMIERERVTAAAVRQGGAPVDRAARARLKGHRPLCVWLTGPAGAAKSGVAAALERRLHRLGLHTMLVDDDKLQPGMGRPARLTEGGQAERVLRLGDMVHLLMDGGLLVLASANATTQGERDAVRGLLPAGQFVEVLVGVPTGSAQERNDNTPLAIGQRPELRLVSTLGEEIAAYQPPEISMDVGQGTANWQDDGGSRISDAVARIAQLAAFSPGQRS